MQIKSFICQQFGQPIRLLLAYTGEDVDDKRYTFDAVEEWQNDKFKLGLDFPNVLYIEKTSFNFSLILSLSNFIFQSCILAAILFG